MDNFDLSFDTQPDRFVMRNRRLQNLQCNFSAGCAIDGSTARAHGAGAERLDKLKRFESLLCHGLADRSLKVALRKSQARVTGLRAISRLSC